MRFVKPRERPQYVDYIDPAPKNGRFTLASKNFAVPRVDGAICRLAADQRFRLDGLHLDQDGRTLSCESSVTLVG